MVARFAILLLVLSTLIDLSGRTAHCFDPARPFVPESLLLCLLFSIGLSVMDLNEASLDDLLWHYLPALVASLSIAIAWTLKDRRADAGMSTPAPPILRHPAVRFALLLLVLSGLYDVSTPVSYCFSPARGAFAESFPGCFLHHYEILIRGLGKGGLPGLVWHFLPVFPVTLLITVVWAWKDRRRVRN